MYGVGLPAGQPNGELEVGKTIFEDLVRVHTDAVAS